MHVKDATLENATKAASWRHFPLLYNTECHRSTEQKVKCGSDAHLTPERDGTRCDLVDDFEGNILIRGTCMEAYDLVQRVATILDKVLGRDRLVD